MKIEKIKPIPKYIARKIEKMDKSRNLAYNAKRFYAYFTKNDGELVKVTVAARSYQGKVYLKQVAVHGVDSDFCFCKDMEFHYMAGYMVGWYDMGLVKHKPWYEDGKWYKCTPEKLYDPFALRVNTEYITTFPEFQYSAIEKYAYEDVLKYLRTYREYPEMEFLTKLGLSRIALSKQILRLARKSKAFRKWLGKNRLMLEFEPHDIKVIIDAFRTGKDIRLLQQIYNRRKQFYHESGLKDLRAFIKGETDKFLEYIECQNTNFRSYDDYLTACRFLGVDMTLDKNRYPHEFKRWHDTRIAEYRSERAKRDEERRKEFYESFRAVAEKYGALQFEKLGFVCIIAKSPTELDIEGSILHHCVGGMGYDQKVIDERSLIFFIRKAESPETPLVTVEYSVKEKKVLQCYGDHDTKPSEEILSFVHQKWLPYAKRQMKKIAA